MFNISFSERSVENIICVIR